MFEQAIEIIKKEAAKAAQYEEQSCEFEYGSAAWERLENKRIKKENEVDGQIILIAKMFGRDIDEIEEMIWS